MAFNISPSVNVREFDSSLEQKELGDYIGAMVIKAQWGAINKPILITNGESEYTQRFWRPDGNTYLSALVAHDFLSYSPKAWFYRAAGDNTINAVPSPLAAVLVRNEDELQVSALNGYDFIAKYAGSLGNGLTVSIADEGSFDTWEFRNSFEFKPDTGEFSIAVVDGSGKFTGTGAARQQERLSMTGSVVGGIRQVESLEVIGTATGGTKQVETLTFTGTATGTTLTVDGVAVTLVVSDDAQTVASKVAAALAALPLVYLSAVAIGATVVVTYAIPVERVRIPSGSESGILFSSAINVLGSVFFTVVLNNEVVTLQYNDTATDVAAKIKAVLLSRTSKYLTVTDINPTTLSYTYVAYGASTIPSDSAVDGLIYDFTITTTGDNATSIVVFGQTVDVLNGDSATTVASKIALNLNSMPIPLFDSIYAKKNGIYYTSQLDGLQTEQTPPVAQKGLIFDIDVVVVGRLGTLVERFELLTEGATDVFADGTPSYWVSAINSRSDFIYAGDPSIALSARNLVMQGGIDDYTVNFTDGVRVFGNSEVYELNYLITGAVSVQEQKAAIDVASTRKDCLVFASPQFTDVVDNRGSEVEDIKEWRTLEVNRETSYLVNDDNWGYIYDSYNRVFRWIPTCGGTAGLKARTDRDVSQYASPAGFENGLYKNYSKLAWSANKSQRDELYKIGVNSVVDFAGRGMVLFGDKTSLTRPSAFDRINVRSTFIVIEKSLSNLAQYFLFKLNNEFTRAQFTNQARSFLSAVQAKGAFADFQFVCDERNNTAQTQATNTLVGTVKIRPTYVINYIDLNFVAVGSNLTFDEVANTF